jgi:hypothetical protein
MKKDLKLNKQELHNVHFPLIVKGMNQRRGIRDDSLTYSLGFWLDNRAIGTRLPARTDIFTLCTAFRPAAKTTQTNCIGTGLSPCKYSNWSMELASCFYPGPKLTHLLRNGYKMYPRVQFS